MPDVQELILIGKVLGTHGIRGQLRIVPYSGDPASITSLRTFFLGKPGGQYESYVIERAVVHKKRALVKLKDLDDINQVLSLAGREVFIHRDQLPELSDGEYYWCDLIGLEVRTEEGDILGDLKNILETGSNDVYVVMSGEREILIPATEEVVLAVDLDGRSMTVRLPDGLLDL
ncbi:MAG TPA: ribosome maturation factor RimM [Geobacteraceae bacterium]|nr:ribosome maturation factor RimM [Geobacteraceae bacterium]